MILALMYLLITFPFLVVLFFPPFTHSQAIRYLSMTLLWSSNVCSLSFPLVKPSERTYRNIPLFLFLFSSLFLSPSLPRSLTFHPIFLLFNRAFFPNQNVLDYGNFLPFRMPISFRQCRIVVSRRKSGELVRKRNEIRTSFLGCTFLKEEYCTFKTYLYTLPCFVCLRWNWLVDNHNLAIICS